nr:DUF2071 domain-containing protein [Neobacillus sp. Marseille-Q6967]
MKKSWIIKQTWEHLLFLHWETAPERILPLLPDELELDLFAGKAWITVLPFRVTHQRFHGLPEIPFLNTYLELNVRTYVKYKGMAGVYFFTLDANHPLTVLGAKSLSLPYRHAKMALENEGKNIIFKSSRLLEEGEFSVLYEPVSEPRKLEPGSLDYWLLERYCLFTKWGNKVVRGDIRHKNWEVIEAKIERLKNSVLPIDLKTAPVLHHYSLRKEAFIISLKPQ